MDNNNNNNNNNNNKQFRYYSSGSFGVLIKNQYDDYIYKITEFTDYIYIPASNFNEMIYLNFFKLKYPELYNKIDNTLPIQNVSTAICTLDYFVKMYNIDNDLINKIKNKLQIYSIDLIIINKMKFYPYNLDKLRKKLNFNEIYLGIEKIILGLHFFHSNDIAHGDFKSINIVGDKNDLRLIDFGGIKLISNPKYECTCTCTYRAPEDFEFEAELNDTKNPYLKYTNDPLKSDIWSLGLVLNEMINGINPIQVKYNSLRANNINYTQEDIEKNILLYFKKIKKNILSYTTLFSIDAKIITDINKYKINKVIQQMLNIEPDKRIELNEVYLNLFYQELPDFEKEKSHFDYTISNNNYYNKFIDFRNYYYQLIRFSLVSLNEEYLYPFIANLFDRFAICIINSNLSNLSNYNDNHFFNYKFLIDMINYSGDYDKNYTNLLYNTNIIYCAMYIISKLIVLKKNIEFKKEIGKLQGYLNLGWENISKVDIIYICEQIIGIIQVLNYDIVRTKLFMYSNTNKESINYMIEIIESFDVEKIIKYIE
jgi:serine/threonine protein kinase